MILKVGLRDGNRELGAFRGVTRLVVDGNQGRGGVSSSSIAGHNDICQS